MSDHERNALKARLSREIKDFGIDAWGIADASIINEKAPRGFAPEDILPGARSVLVIAQRMPLGPALQSVSEIGQIFYMRSFWSSAQAIDAASWNIARTLEGKGFHSVPVPTYGPMRVYNGEPRGLISLKHAAQIAGMGSISRNSLLVNPVYGNLLRLGAIVTTAPLPQDKPDMSDPCPPGCRACIQACPVDAIKGYSIDIKACMKLSIRHPLMRPFAITGFLLWLSKKNRGIHGFVEDLNNMLVTHYSESCTRCLLACPYFRKALKTTDPKYNPALRIN